MFHLINFNLVKPEFLELQIVLPNWTWNASFGPHHAATYAATSNVLVHIDTLHPIASTGTFICLLTHEL